MKKKTRKESGEATLASVQKEMAKPRMAESARQVNVNRAAGRMAPVKRGRAN